MMNGLDTGLSKNMAAVQSAHSNWCITSCELSDQTSPRHKYLLQKLQVQRKKYLPFRFVRTTISNGELRFDEEIVNGLIALDSLQPRMSEDGCRKGSERLIKAYKMRITICDAFIDERIGRRVA